MVPAIGVLSIVVLSCVPGSLAGVVFSYFEFIHDGGLFYLLFLVCSSA